MTNTQKAAASLARDMRSVADDVEHLLHDVGASGRSSVREWRGRVGDALAAARARYDDLDTGVRNGTRQAVTATNDYVHHSPWQAIGVGLVVGLVSGFLIMRRW